MIERTKRDSIIRPCLTRFENKPISAFLGLEYIVTGFIDGDVLCRIYGLNEAEFRFKSWVLIKQ